MMDTFWLSIIVLQILMVVGCFVLARLFKCAANSSNDGNNNNDPEGRRQNNEGQTETSTQTSVVHVIDLPPAYHEVVVEIKAVKKKNKTTNESPSVPRPKAGEGHSSDCESCAAAEEEEEEETLPTYDAATRPPPMPMSAAGRSK